MDNFCTLIHSHTASILDASKERWIEISGVFVA